jgi:hypothetical protein
MMLLKYMYLGCSCVGQGLLGWITNVVVVDVVSPQLVIKLCNLQGIASI